MTMNRPWRTSHPDYQDHVVPGVTGGGLPALGDELVDAVLNQRKTTHRLVAHDPAVEPLHRGRSYAVQRRSGERASCHVVVQDLQLERVRDITDRDAIAEGFDGAADWMHWLAFNVLGLTSLAALDRTMHVWVVIFELDLSDQGDVFLARQSQYGYTTKPHLAMREPDAAVPVLADVDELERLRRKWARLAGEDYRTETVTKPALEYTDDDRELHRLVAGRSGRDPEDAAASISHRFPDVTPGMVRKIRRDVLEVRAIDGKPPFSEEETERFLTAMFATGRPSVRDVCRVLDCSTTTARLVIKDRERRAA